MLNIKEATTKELLDFYNKHTDRQIIKFRDRKTAEERCLKLMNSIEEVPVNNNENPSNDIEIIIEPSEYLSPCRQGTKVAAIVDVMWEGSTQIDVLKILGETKKTKANTAKFNHWLRWNVNKDKGYGIAKRIVDGEELFYITTREGAKKLEHIKRKGASND